MKTNTNKLTIDNKVKNNKKMILKDDDISVKTSKTQRILTNISKKLGLSLAIYQR